MAFPLLVYILGQIFVRCTKQADAHVIRYLQHAFQLCGQMHCVCHKSEGFMTSLLTFSPG